MHHLSVVSTTKQNLMTKHNKNIDKPKSPDIRKILLKNPKIIYKDNKNRLQIFNLVAIKI